jgi:diaminopimelate decarboxylase
VHLILKFNFMLTNQKILELSSRHKKPFFAYDLKTTLERINELKQTIGIYPKTEFLYAMKANHNPHIVKFIVDNGFGIDGVSINEIKLALHIGCPKEKIMFTENNITSEIMDEAFELGILINFNSLSLLEKFGKKYPGNKVCIRFNPNVGAGSHSTNITAGPNSKFGISYLQIDKVLEIARKYNLNIVGIHQHIGSGWLGLEEPLLAMDVILDIARQIPNLEFVDFGGGFGAPYRPDQQRNDLVKLGQLFLEKIQTFNQEYKKEIIMRYEPGRYPVQECCDLVTEVTDIKLTPEGLIFAGLNTGMNHLIRPALYGAYHPIRNISNPNGKPTRYDVTGNNCECADLFGKDRELPETSEQDIIAIGMAGAYGAAMSSNYNLVSHAQEIAIYPDGTEQVIRVEQSFQDLIQPYNFTPSNLN